MDLALFLIVEQAGDLTAFDDVLFDDLFGVFGFNLDVEGVLRQDLDNRPLFAKAQATGAYNLHLVDQAVLFDRRFQRVEQLHAPDGIAGRSAAH